MSTTPSTCLGASPPSNSLSMTARRAASRHDGHCGVTGYCPASKRSSAALGSANGKTSPA